MKKILLVVPNLVSGGGQKLAVDIACTLNKQKFDVVVLSLYSKQNTIFEKILENNNIKVKFLSKDKGVDLSIIKDIFQFMKMYKADVVHTHLSVVQYMLIPALIIGVKTKIHTIHTLGWRESRGIKRIIMGLAYKNFGFIPVAISELNKKTVVEEYRLKEEKVKCIHNGVDTFKFLKKDKCKCLNKRNLRFISVARFEPVKNHRLMIEAFEKTYKQYKNIELVLVGDGYLRKDIENLIYKKNLKDKIILKGISDKICEELSDSDVYLMSSDVEGLPLSVLEAMSCELPIITTAAGGVIDIVVDGWNGFVTPTKDADKLSESMKKVILDEKLRYEMGINSRKRAIEFDIQRCVSGYENLYIK